ncbi:hypothetical protein M2156_006591 [Streptomyces sp. SAI-149]|nr:hypothetical protein [Streptomyces sp. SAI-119]MDH6500372.1 hypothetical protein [Streptomyces sp. SAI-149]
MRLRRIAVAGVVLGLVGVLVRAEGRAMGRVLLRRNDAGTSGTPGDPTDRTGTETTARRAATPRERLASGSGTGDRTDPVPGPGEGVRGQSVVASRVGAENKAFHTPGHIEAADLVKSWNGSALHQIGTLFNGCPVDLLAVHNAYNSGSGRDLTADVGRPPTLHTKIDSAETADRQVARGAGAGRIP